MDLTHYLAHLWGPALLAFGIGLFFSRAYYLRVYRDLEQNAFAVIFFGMAGTAAGIAQVLAHNVWGTLPEVLISLLGWGLLIKGLVCTAFPNLADRSANRVLTAAMMPFVGAALLVLGAYLSWFAYFTPAAALAPSMDHAMSDGSKQIASALYTCDNSKTVSAAFFEGTPAAPVAAGQPPVPTGSVEVSLDGAASTTLRQTLSADGARYANADESFVFWNKGNEALIMRNNTMDLDYKNCTNTMKG